VWSGGGPRVSRPPGQPRRKACSILWVSRTLADVEGKEAILSQHVSEAIQHRTLERNSWVVSASVIDWTLARIAARSALTELRVPFGGKWQIAGLARTLKVATIISTHAGPRPNPF
jgi:hypothetical protein